MKAYHLTPLILIAIVLSACKHDQYDVRGCGEFDSYQDVKAFGFFNTGTYWIYENQQTLERDTFTVYDTEIGFSDGIEVGFFIRMKRSFENAEFRYYHNGNQNVFPPDYNCELRRIWMSRVSINDNGQEINSEQSALLFPVVEGSHDYSYSSCGSDMGGGYMTVLNIEEQDILDYQNVAVFSSEGLGFSLNPCIGDTYRYQFGRGIGLVSWENLDSLDGKWELVEFERD